MQIDFIIIILVALIFSAIIHEIAHGYAALMLGDPTAKLAGRLTLNPLPHLDPLGSIIIPALLIFTGAGFVFGWAKPVPYNPYNLRGGRYSEAWVAGAGPLTNVFIALVFGLLIRFGIMFGYLSVGSAVVQIASIIVFINILLALFNMIPIPPLDGSKVLASILPFHMAEQYGRLQEFMMRYGLLATFGFIFLFIYLFSSPFFAFVSFIFTLITGTTLF